MDQRRLFRSESDKMFAGVCGGIAGYLGVDSVFVRLAFLLLIFASGVGVILYIILMLIMPGEDNLGKAGGEILQDNVNQLGNDMSSGFKRVRKHPQGPVIAAGLLIALGLFLLFENLGFFSWVRPEIFFSLALIGLGLYLLVRQGRS